MTTKQLFLVSFGVGFGAITALLIATVILMTTGVVKQSPFGGIRWNIGNSGGLDLETYRRNKELLKGITYENIKYTVDQDDNSIKVMYDVINPHDEKIDDLLRLNFILNYNGDLVTIIDGIESINIGKKSRLTLITNLRNDKKITFNEIKILSKH
jgi:hypothetical protein